MAKSKYEFSKLKNKSLPAKIVDSTAVRVLVKAAKKLSSGWKNFAAYTGTTIGNIKAGNVNVTEMDKIAEKIEVNNNLVDTIREDKRATAADFKVAVKAQRENARLEAKLGKMLNKQIILETRKATETIDLNAAIDDALGANGKTKTSTDELNKLFDEVGVGMKAVETEMPVLETPTVVPTVEPVIEPSVVEPVAPIQAPTGTTNELDLQRDPIVTATINAIKTAKSMAAENQRLVAEMKTKNDRIAGLETSEGSLKNEIQSKNDKINNLEASEKSLTEDNKAKDEEIGNYKSSEEANVVVMKTISDENQLLRETNSTQAVTIAKVSKENESLQEIVKNQALKNNQYEKDFIAMRKTLDELMAIKQERDFYKGQFALIANELGSVQQAVTPAVAENSMRR